MPLIRDIVTDDIRCAVWRVTEGYDELLLRLPDKGAKLRHQAEQRFKSSKRRLEFVAVRVLLYEMLKRETVIAYHEDGSPYLLDEVMNISLSHTEGVVAVILSPSRTVGVDVEQYGLRITKLADRIVGPEERAFSVWDLLLHWSAKETVYKMIHCREVDFIRHLQLEPFAEDDDRRVGKNGNFILQVKHPEHQMDYGVSYELFEDFVLTYSFK